jgi:aspartate aminotransferase
MSSALYDLANRVKKIKESPTLKMNALARELEAKGEKVLNLTAGEPDWSIPSIIKQAAIEAIEKNFSKYTQVSGILELRKLISKKLQKENSLFYEPDEICVSVGAKQAIFNALLCVLNENDECIIPAPYWVSYPEMVLLAGGVPVIVETNEKQEFKLTADALKKVLTPKTRVLILNSPSNPTGTVYTKKELEALAKVLEGTQVLVISDEIYEKLTFVDREDEDFVSFGSVSSDAFKRTLTVNGFSKTYAMTGWRLGYIAGPKTLIQAISMIQGQSTSNATSIVQKAAIEAFKVTDKEINEYKKELKLRRDAMAEIFASNSNFSFFLPKGAFYLFLNVEHCLNKKYTDSSGSCKVLSSVDELCFYLLDKQKVVTVSGSGFGSQKHIRVSFSTSLDIVKEGAKKIVSAF